MYILKSKLYLAEHSGKHILLLRCKKSTLYQKNCKLNPHDSSADTEASKAYFNAPVPTKKSASGLDLYFFWHKNSLKLRVKCLWQAKYCLF